MLIAGIRTFGLMLSLVLVALVSAAPAWAGTPVTVRMAGESSPGRWSGGLNVELVSLDPAGPTYSGKISRETGRAVFPDVEPGRYEIRVTPPTGSEGGKYASDYREIPAEGRAEFGFRFDGLPYKDGEGDGMAGKRRGLHLAASNLHVNDNPEYEKYEEELRAIRNLNQFGEERLDAMILEVLDDMRASTRNRAERALAEDSEDELLRLVDDLERAVDQVKAANAPRSDEDVPISAEAETDYRAVLTLIRMKRRRDMHRTLRMEAEEELRNAPSKDGGKGQADETSQVPVIPGGEAQPVGYSDAFDIAPGSAFSLSFDAGYGQIDRGDIQLPLRVEEGGLFREAISIEPGWNDTFSVSGGIELNLGPAFGYSPEFLASKRLGLSIGYLSSDASGSIDFIEGGDGNPFVDGSVLLDPGGLAGGIGGGGIKLADSGIGFADHRDVRADSEYEAFRVGLDLSNSYRFGDILVRPRTGVYYGYTDEDVGISGVTGNGLVDYRYRNDLGSDRLGAEFALETNFRATDALRFTFTPRIALSEVWASGKSALEVDVGGVPFASSSESGIDETFTSFEYSISGGAEYDLSDNATLTLEGTWGSGENPALEFEPEERAKIESERYDSWTITAGVRINF